MRSSLRHRLAATTARRVPRRGRADAGESLLEIVITVVVIGVTVTALVSGLASVSAAGEAHRQVCADTVMRNYAEAAKAAARACTVGGTWQPVYSPPSGYTVSRTPASSACPPIATPARVDLTVASPSGVTQTMTIVVRTP
ncbi:MAG: hypothetical protein R2713_09465 [Ilumatobacteraceae bacterium]